MININFVNEKFDEYVKSFDCTNEKIKLKFEHIKRVTQVSEKIARNLNLPEEYVNLAQVIGLFHDIGRFKQTKLYNTFNDRVSVNHAKLGVEVLFDEGLIDKFNIDKKYYKIIRSAILNHSTLKIEEGLSEDEVLFSKIIRDADKLDIYYTFCNYDFKSTFWYSDFDCDTINDTALEQFMNESIIDYKNVHTNADQIIVCFGYMYDFNFKYSLKYLKDMNYLEKLTEKIMKYFKSDKVKTQVKKVLRIANEYIDKICISDKIMLK